MVGSMSGFYLVCSQTGTHNTIVYLMTSPCPLKENPYFLTVLPPDPNDHYSDFCHKSHFIPDVHVLCPWSHTAHGLGLHALSVLPRFIHVSCILPRSSLSKAEECSVMWACHISQ